MRKMTHMTKQRVEKKTHLFFVVCLFVFCSPFLLLFTPCVPTHPYFLKEIIIQVEKQENKRCFHFLSF